MLRLKLTINNLNSVNLYRMIETFTEIFNFYK